ncbi:MutT/nudix family protein [Paenibacillus sp. FSL R7-277]|uniref:8-oxo-dGTP pyrophosphatase MutT (NUDIX family) n=1 Tax=Paenibacillus silagei TaxID=1670801 RepID=A0ABS4NM24_9BACL|nr:MULTISPECIES: NUDIX domain-containing protein [Paenibacillus]ETT63032.1 MutT/nudix family protein [Paenibacillus sp. FSL R7-277]MBP2111094.1 8-oxo-dGTP pyrophosphatase MutT (NUDIX family) [Paenibacillus silagei]
MTNVIDKVAWIYVVDGKVLGARSKGKDTYYFPGGKREPGESDAETLIREVEEELSVQILPETIAEFGSFEAPAHGKAEGVLVRMTCLTADFTGELAPASEIEELAWLTYKDIDRVSAVSVIIMDKLREMSLIS